MSPVLRLEGIHAGYGTKEIVGGVSLEACRGEITLILGPNGCGKSTLLKAIVGLAVVTKGMFVVNGKEQRRPSLEQCLRLGIAYAPQGGRVYRALSVGDNVRLAASVLPSEVERRRAIEEVLEQLPVVRTKLHQSAGSLSGGERQLLVLARAMVTRPRLLLLDEPTAALAPATADNILKTIADWVVVGERAVLMIEQNVAPSLPYADRLYVIRDGKLVLHHIPPFELQVVTDAFLGSSNRSRCSN